MVKVIHPVHLSHQNEWKEQNKEKLCIKSENISFFYIHPHPHTLILFSKISVYKMTIEKKRNGNSNDATQNVHHLLQQIFFFQLSIETLFFSLSLNNMKRHTHIWDIVKDEMKILFSLNFILESASFSFHCKFYTALCLV